MANLLKKLKKINHLIKDKKSELRETEVSVYYTKMLTEFERKRDVAQIKSEIKDLLSLKFSVLESLQTEFEKMKYSISSEEKALTLQINS